MKDTNNNSVRQFYFFGLWSFLWAGFGNKIFGRIRVFEACLAFVLVYFCLVPAGCIVSHTLELIRPERPPGYSEISSSYRGVEVKESSASDALNLINMTDYELLSQSKSVLACSGEKKEWHKLWFTLFAFDEDKLAVQRKYLFIVDEKAKTLFREPWEGFWFDFEAVIASEVLDEPYADENARRIAILEHILEKIRSDIDEVGADNKMVSISGMLINQSFETVRVKLAASPAMAVKLDEEKGLIFDHINMDKGSINMMMEGDVATVQIRLGSLYQTVPLWYLDKDEESAEDQQEQ